MSHPSMGSSVPLSARDKLEQSRRRWLAKQQAQSQADERQQSHESHQPASIASASSTSTSASPSIQSVAVSSDTVQPYPSTTILEPPIATNVLDVSDAVPASSGPKGGVGRQPRTRHRHRNRNRGQTNQSNPSQNHELLEKDEDKDSGNVSHQTKTNIDDGFTGSNSTNSQNYIHDGNDRQQQSRTAGNQSLLNHTPDTTPEQRKPHHPKPYHQRHNQSYRIQRRGQEFTRQRQDYSDPYHHRRRHDQPSHSQQQRQSNQYKSNHQNYPQLPSPSMVGQLSGIERELNTALRAWNRSDNDMYGTNYTSGVKDQARAENYEWAFIDESDVSDFGSLITEPAMTYPFELDDFQKRAILNIEQGNSVFVAAHTSAGKTAVAEYAIALAGSMEGKTFYTSPIKSLSNQKLRDFRTKFDDVGLVTGDVSINETAQCVIMTTEILRSMLYRGADTIRDVRVVIFDEVQFLNDEERGVVWEESIIMLPPHINIVMLSATVPNALEFSEWVGRTKERKVAVVTTDKRPVPLKHTFLVPDKTVTTEPDKLKEFVLVEQGGPFQEVNYRKARSALIGFRDNVKKETKKGEGQDKEKRGGAQSSKASKRKKKRKHKNSDNDETKNNEGQTSTNVEAEEVNSTAAIDPMPNHNHANYKDIDKDVDKDENSDESDVEDADNDDSVDGNLENTKEEMKEDALSSNENEVVSNLPVSSAHDDEQKKVIKKGNKNKGPTAKSAAASAMKGTTRTSGNGPNRQSAFTSLVRYLEKKDMFPSIVFCFSKMKCEQIVQSLESIDLLPNARDKNYVTAFMDRAIGRLREEDRNLPQVVRTRYNLCRGITAHHAGLLPLVKEVTEMLFSEGYVKVLFATETFAIGVNMPARSVVFSGLNKHDGRRRRILESGEYTQMSGRAGRRGIDKVGNVFMFMAPDERAPELGQLKRTMTAPPISLKSAFRLTYNMILNVLRVDELRVEEVMKQSFSEASIGTRSDNLSEVISRVGTTLGEMNIEKVDDNDDDDDDDDDKDEGVDSKGVARNRGSGGYKSKPPGFSPGISEKQVHRYVGLFAKLKVITEEIPIRSLNNVIRKYLTPGRLVIAEIAPGRLALATVFSLVPPKNTQMAAYMSMLRSGNRDWINKYTTVWLATITGVDRRRLKKHVSSTLILQAHPFNDELRSVEMVEQNKMEFNVMTSTGLIVSLRSVSARNIVYFSDAIDEKVSEARAKDQNTCAFLWHRRNSKQGLKWLHENGDFLERIIRNWNASSSNNSTTTSSSLSSPHIGENSQSRQGEGSSVILHSGLPPEVSTLDAHGGGSTAAITAAITTTQQQHGTFCDIYRQRVELCENMIYDTDLGNGLNHAGGVRIMDGVGAAVIQERVRRQMKVLRKAQQGAMVKEPSLLPEYNQRLSVLERLGYVEEGGLCVFLKGRCACEVATADSVVLTEIIMENILNDLSIPAIASLLSSLLCRKKNDSLLGSGSNGNDEAFFGPDYIEARDAMRDVVKYVGDVQMELGVTLDFELGDHATGGYENAMCRWDLARAVHAWADGQPFCDIAAMTSQQEGDIVVCVKRLCELLKDAQSVAKGVGNTDLVEKLDGVVTAIKRDVIFNASLYYE